MRATANSSGSRTSSSSRSSPRSSAAWTAAADTSLGASAGSGTPQPSASVSSRMVGLSPQTGQAGSFRSRNSRNSMRSASTWSRRPISGSPMPARSFTVSVAWTSAISPGSTPRTPPSAGRHRAGRRRLGEEAAVAGTAPSVEDGRLALEAEDRAVDVRLPEHHAGVVREVARGEVVRAVHDDVVGAEDLEGVLRGQLLRMELDPHVRVHGGDALARDLRLAAPDVRSAVEHLALEIRG